MSGYRFENMGTYETDKGGAGQHALHGQPVELRTASPDHHEHGPVPQQNRRPAQPVSHWWDNGNNR